MRKVLVVLTAQTIALGVLGAATTALAPASHAIENCYIAAAPRYITANTTSTYADAPATLTAYWDQNPPQDCIVGTRFRFIGGGGQDFQDSSPGFVREGSRVKAVAAFTPKSGLSYRVEAYITWQMMGSPYEAYPMTLTLNGGRAFPDAPTPAGQPVPSMEAVDRTITLTWGIPATNAGSVVKFRVNNALNGQQVCETAAGNLGCKLEAVGDGSYAFQVTALNAVGKGTMSGPTNIIKVGPPAPPVLSQVQSAGTNVTLRWTTATESVAVPRTYRVRNSAGEEVCGVAATAADLAAGSMTCAPTLAAGASTQYVVTVETALGNASSAPSPVVSGANPLTTASCLTAKASLKKATKTRNRKLISQQTKRVMSACKAKVVIY